MPHPLLPAPNSAPVRVAIIDASPLVLAALTRMIESSDALTVIGSASNGRAGLELIARARPDAICCATQLPLLSSVELVRAVMSQFPTPILALQTRDEILAKTSGVSVSTAPAIAATAVAMLDEGAVDWMIKPASEPAPTADFLARIARIARVRALTRHRPRTEASEPNETQSVAPPTAATPTIIASSARLAAGTGRVATVRPDIIAIGASTGGPPVLLQLLSALVPSAPPVLCVQHIAQGFLIEMLNWLRAQCRVEIAVASEGELARSGTVYFPAENHHLEIGGNGRLHLSAAPPLTGHRPAVDITFESVARSYSSRALAILLTGMGADGAQGLSKVQRAGGTTWAQTPATCVVAGMPGKAIELGAANSVFTPDEMAQRLARLSQSAK